MNDEKTNALVVHTDDPHKVVENHELEQWTGVGWVLVAILEGDTLETTFDQVANPTPKTDPNDYGYCTTINEQRAVKLRTHRFLLRRPKESVIAEQAHQIGDLQSEVYTAQQDKKRADEEAKKLRTHNEKLQSSLDHRNERFEVLYTENGELIRRLRRMENDMAKVRQDVGARRWKEIMGEDK